MNILPTNFTITFDHELINDVLSAFGKIKDSEGYIIERKSSKRVFTPNGEEIHVNEFAGITRGSEIYLKSDIISLIEFVEKSS